MGCLTITHIGIVGVSPLMHNRNFIFPDQYRAFRIYWSIANPGTRTLYCLEIHSEPIGKTSLRRPLFTIDDMQSNIHFVSNDIHGKDK